MSVALWGQCLSYLEDELSPQQFNTWIRPLQAELNDDVLRLLSPNRFVQDWVTDRFHDRIEELVSQLSSDQAPRIVFEVGSSTPVTPAKKPAVGIQEPRPVSEKVKQELIDKGPDVIDVVVHLEPYE